MITNKMLLSSHKDNIPYKPFPKSMEKIILTDEIILNSNIISSSYTEEFLGLDGFEEIELPKNHCTVLVGISDEYFESFVNYGGGLVNIETVFDIGITSYEYGIVPNYETAVTFNKTIKAISGGLNNWFPSYQEVYVQLDFKYKKNRYLIYPRIYLTPIYFNHTILNDVSITAYPKFYIKMSNEIHEHGPDKIIEIDNSKAIA